MSSDSGIIIMIKIYKSRKCENLFIVSKRFRIGSEFASVKAERRRRSWSRTIFDSDAPPSLTLLLFTDLAGEK